MPLCLSVLLPLFWMALIFYGSSRQKIAVTDSYFTSFLIFKSLHVLEYGILFLLWNFSLEKIKHGTRYALVISILYGMLDEFHQTFVPTRGGRPRDVLIDALGVFLFWWVLKRRIDPETSSG